MRYGCRSTRATGCLHRICVVLSLRLLHTVGYLYAIYHCGWFCWFLASPFYATVYCWYHTWFYFTHHAFLPHFAVAFLLYVLRFIRSHLPRCLHLVIRGSAVRLQFCRARLHTHLDYTHVCYVAAVLRGYAVTHGAVAYAFIPARITRFHGLRCRLPAFVTHTFTDVPAPPAFTRAPLYHLQFTDYRCRTFIHALPVTCWLYIPRLHAVRGLHTHTYVYRTRVAVYVTHTLRFTTFRVYRLLRYRSTFTRLLYAVHAPGLFTRFTWHTTHAVYRVAVVTFTRLRYRAAVLPHGYTHHHTRLRLPRGCLFTSAHLRLLRSTHFPVEHALRSGSTGWILHARVTLPLGYWLSSHVHHTHTHYTGCSPHTVLPFTLRTRRLSAIPTYGSTGYCCRWTYLPLPAVPPVLVTRLLPRLRAAHLVTHTLVLRCVLRTYRLRIPGSHACTLHTGLRLRHTCRRVTLTLPCRGYLYLYHGSAIPLRIAHILPARFNYTAPRFCLDYPAVLRFWFVPVAVAVRVRPPAVVTLLPTAHLVAVRILHTFLVCCTGYAYRVLHCVVTRTRHTHTRATVVAVGWLHLYGCRLLHTVTHGSLRSLHARLPVTAVTARLRLRLRYTTCGCILDCARRTGLRSCIAPRLRLPPSGYVTCLLVAV